MTKNQQRILNNQRAPHVTARIPSLFFAVLD
jgi:hypothetical protein